MAIYYRVEAKDHQITDEVKRHKLALMTGSTLLSLCYFYGDSQISSFLIFKLRENGEQVVGLYPFLLAFAAYHFFMYVTLLNQLITDIKNLTFSKLTRDSIDLPEDLKKTLSNIDNFKMATIDEAVETQNPKRSLYKIHKHLTALKSIGQVDSSLIYEGFRLLNNDPLPVDIDSKQVANNLAKYIRTLESYQSLILAGDEFEVELHNYTARINCLDNDLEIWKQKQLKRIAAEYSALAEKIHNLDSNFKKSSAWEPKYFNCIYRAIPYSFFWGTVVLSTFAFLNYHFPTIIVHLI